MNTQSITLDVTKRPHVAPVVYIGQGDKSGTVLAVMMFDDGAALALSGYSVRLCMRLPDGESYYSVAGTVSGNVATFSIDETYAAAVAGVTDVAYVEVYSGSTLICSTNRFRIVVLEGAREGVSPTEAHYDEIVQAAVEASEAAAVAAAATIASATSSASNAALAANQAASAANSAADAANEAAQAAVTNVKCYYTTETVGGNTLLTMVYDLVNE